MPTTFINSNECTGTTTYALVFPGGSGWIGNTPAGWPTALPYANTWAGLQQFVTDMEAYRSANGTGILGIIPNGSAFTNSTALIISQSNSTPVTSCNVLKVQSPNLSGQPVCAHGMQDVLAVSLNPGLINADCAGDALSYYLGTTPTTLPTNALFNDASRMWSLTATGVNNAPLQTCSPLGTGLAKCTGTIGPDHWEIDDLAASPQAGLSTTVHVIQLLDNGGETTTSQFPSHMHFKRMWVHGDWTSLVAGANSISNGFVMDCIYCSISDSQVSQVLRPGGEGHSIGFGKGSQLKFVNNWLEGSSSSIFGGGGFTGIMGITGYVPGQDVQVGMSRLTFPFTWMTTSQRLPNTNTNFSCVPQCQAIARKNITESKQAERIVRYGIIGENSDNSGGQNGPEVVMDPRNTSAGIQGNNYQATITDIYDYGEIWRNTCWGLEVEGRSNYPANGGGVSQLLRRVWFTQVLDYNISNLNPGCLSGITPVPSTGHIFGTGGENWQVRITEDATGTLATATLVCSNMAAGNCPAGPPPLGLEVTGISAGDPVAITGCTSVTSFNTPTTTAFSVSPLPILGGLAINGTNPFGTSVTWPHIDTPNASDNSLNCMLANTQGGPVNLQLTHVTTISDSARTIGASNTLGTYGPAYGIGNLFRDSIFVGSGGWTSAIPEGTKAENWITDFNTATLDHLVWPGRTASKYTEYGNNVNFPNPFCLLLNGCSPPNTWYFPATSYTTGLICDATSVCFKGTKNLPVGPLPLTLTDFTQWALDPTSVFASAGINHASDGTDMGASIPAILTAQTMTQFICPYSGCSAYQDNPLVNILQFYTNDTLPWWNNAGGGVVQLVQTPANTVIDGATIQMYWSDIDDLLTGTVAVTNGSTAATLTCLVNCTHQSQMNGWVINGIYYDGSISGNAITLSLPYGGTTNGAVAIHGYNFTYPDSKYTPWTNAGKTVNWVAPMVVCSTGCSDGTANANNYGLGGVGNLAAPSNLWTALGTDFVTCSSQRTPNWLNSIVISNYESAITAFYSHYAQKPNVRYGRVPLGHGGESLPAPTWNSAGDATCRTFFRSVLGSTITSVEVTNWFNNWTSVILDFGLTLRQQLWSQYQRVPTLMAGVTPMNGNQLADLIAPRSVQDLWGFGSQGLEAPDINNCVGSTADWCSLFNMWWANVPTELQTVGQSCPPGILTCTGNQALTGSLVPLLNYAAGKKNRIFEIYNQDVLLGTVGSGYCTAANGANYTSGQCAVIQPAYQALFQATASGTNSLYNSGP